ncbi:hypothetical protein IWW57_006117, partial [Coemansia sp. S610]
RADPRLLQRAPRGVQPVDSGQLRPDPRAALNSQQRRAAGAAGARRAAGAEEEAREGAGAATRAARRTVGGVAGARGGEPGAHQRGVRRRPAADVPAVDGGGRAAAGDAAAGGGRAGLGHVVCVLQPVPRGDPHVPVLLRGVRAAVGGPGLRELRPVPGLLRAQLPARPRAPAVVVCARGRGRRREHPGVHGGRAGRVPRAGGRRAGGAGGGVRARRLRRGVPGAGAGSARLGAAGGGAARHRHGHRRQRPRRRHRPRRLRVAAAVRVLRVRRPGRRVRGRAAVRVARGAGVLGARRVRALLARGAGDGGRRVVQRRRGAAPRPHHQVRRVPQARRVRRLLPRALPAVVPRGVHGAGARAAGARAGVLVPAPPRSGRAGAGGGRPAVRVLRAAAGARAHVDGVRRVPAEGPPGLLRVPGVLRRAGRAGQPPAQEALLPRAPGGGARPPAPAPRRQRRRAVLPLLPPPQRAPLAPGLRRR